MPYLNYDIDIPFGERVHGRYRYDTSYMGTQYVWLFYSDDEYVTDRESVEGHFHYPWDDKFKSYGKRRH